MEEIRIAYVRRSIKHEGLAIDHRGYELLGVDALHFKRRMDLRLELVRSA